MKISRLLCQIIWLHRIQSETFLFEDEVFTRGGALTLHCHVALGGKHCAGPGTEAGLGRRPEAEKGKEPRDHGGSAAGPKVFSRSTISRRKWPGHQHPQAQGVGRIGFEIAAQFLPHTFTRRKCADAICCNMFL